MAEASRRGSGRRVRAAVAVAGIAILGSAALGSPRPYVDPTLLHVPWGHYSFVRQGWRGYLETVPAARFRDGLGVVWQGTPPGRSADDIAGLLAWAGFHRVRFEIPWGSVQWDESRFQAPDERRIREVVGALRAHGLRPLILLNANHLQPCPVQWREVRVVAGAAEGDRSFRVRGAFAVPAESAAATVMSLADGTTAGPLITGRAVADAASDIEVLQLSKPLPHAIAAEEGLRIALLRYAPLHPVGTAQFEATATGWLRYVELATRLVDEAYGSDDYDVEIWNELTFGSAFLDVANYREPTVGDGGAPEFLHTGGSAWELAHRTVEWIKHAHPRTQVIWGFSNTTFFHTPVGELPVRIDGQSYHPYGTGRRCYKDLVRGRRELLLDDYVPDGCVVQPEGYAHAWQQTESLLRFLAPDARGAHAPGTEAFQHFITEHGLSPREIGIEAPGAAERAKELFLLRAPLLWLNKGLTAIYVYDLYEPDTAGFGLLRGDGSVSPALASLHRITAAFAGPTLTAPPRQLALDIAREGRPAGILPGDPDGRHLRQEEAAALLPFQLDAGTFLIAAYVMTQNFPTPLAPQPYRVTVRGVDGRGARVDYYSPLEGRALPVRVADASPGTLTLRLTLTDTPGLIRIHEASRPGHRGGA